MFLRQLATYIKFTFILFAILLSEKIASQEIAPDYIKTIQIKSSAKGNQTNVAPLGGSLYFSFDDLEADQKSYYYKVEHMTHDWKPSRLISSQYINGFQQNIILNIENSFNTFQSYSHYNFTIPNRNTVLTKSGNYLVSVLNEDDEIVFSRKVTFYENIATVGVSVSRSRQAFVSNQEQTIQFTVNHPTLKINFPEREINVAVLQNQNWKTSIPSLPPQYFRNNQLVYRYIDKTNFFGGNEYLNFDTKFIRNQGVNIQRVVRKEIFHNYLYPIESKEIKNYTYNPDINGQYIVRTLEGAETNVEADYSWIHFSLIPTEREKDLELYVYGSFNNFDLKSDNKLSFNPTTKAYEAAILLKQGFYNYTFVTKENNQVNPGAILGNFSKTENRYDVLVYYKPMGSLYDRVIGLGTIKFRGEF